MSVVLSRENEEDLQTTNVDVPCQVVQYGLPVSVDIFLIISQTETRNSFCSHVCRSIWTKRGNVYKDLIQMFSVLFALILPYWCTGEDLKFAIQKQQLHEAAIFVVRTGRNEGTAPHLLGID